MERCSGSTLDWDPRATLKWDQRFLQRAFLTASWSKDPRHRVGCVVVDDQRNELSGGFNGFPRGVIDDGRLQDRDAKLKIIVHAEANAIAAAARNGHSLKGGILYCTLTPCPQCASLIIQSGIERVVIPLEDPGKQHENRTYWIEAGRFAINLLQEAGVKVGRVPLGDWGPFLDFLLAETPKNEG